MDNNGMVSVKRNMGMDIYRILCCIGVLGYHVLDDVLTLRGTKELYFLCSFCVPGFFLLSGFLLGSKDKINIEYCEKKIFSVLGKLFGWILFWSVLNFMKTGILYDVWKNLSDAFVSEGIEPVAWFLFTYCIILIISPLLHSLFKRNSAMFSTIAVLWMIYVATGRINFIRDTMPQSLWIYVYLGYFAIGMAVSYLFELIKDSKMTIVTLLIDSFLWCLSSVAYYFERFVKISSEVPAEHYGTWYYTMWLVTFFWLICHIKIEHNKFRWFISRLSNNTFTVYLGHLPILLYVTSKYTLQSLGIAVICIVFIFVITQCMAELFRKIPLLRKIV